jgi:hypothetical protein
MRLRNPALIFLLSVSLTSLAADNEQLRTIVSADQAERQGSHTPEEWTDISRRDAGRRVQVQAELAAGRIQSSADYFNAALVMQHGETLEEIRMAHALATISASLDPSNRSARWLKAASWDRMLLRQKKPQWYGTQYVKDADDKWALYTVDEAAVTDAERVEMAAPTLAEAKKRVEMMNNAR